MALNSAILITGATGFVGSELIPRLLAARPGATLHCLTRARDAAELARRREGVLAHLGLGGDEAARVVAVTGDVVEPDLGLGHDYDALAARCSEIYHAAATTRFDLPLEEARRINCDGTRHVLAFARAAQESGALRRLNHVSTAYVARGDTGGSFYNTYEQTKWESEREVRRAAQELPLTCYRPSIVVGDSRTGRTLHFRVIYEPMKWVVFGRTNLLPCRPEVRLDVVPVDYVCDAIVALAGLPEARGGTYRLTAGPERALAIADLIDISLEVGNAYVAEMEGQPPIPAPEIVSPERIAQSSGEERERLEKLFEIGTQVTRAFAPYMLEEELFDDAETRAALSGLGIACPPLRDYLPRLIRYAGDRRFDDPEAAEARAHAARA